MLKMVAILKSRWQPFLKLRWPPRKQQPATFQVLLLNLHPLAS